MSIDDSFKVHTPGTRNEIRLMGTPLLHETDIIFSCVYFTSWNNNEIIRDECPYKESNKDKKCIRLGKMCKNLNAELVEVLKRNFTLQG